MYSDTAITGDNFVFCIINLSETNISHRQFLFTVDGMISCIYFRYCILILCILALSNDYPSMKAPLFRCMYKQCNLIPLLQFDILDFCILNVSLSAYETNPPPQSSRYWEIIYFTDLLGLHKALHFCDSGIRADMI